MLTTLTLYLVAGFILDLVFGDPRWGFHPVRLLGRLIAGVESFIRRAFRSEGGLRTGGVILAITVVGLACLSTEALLWAAGRINPWLFHAVNVLLIYSVLATRSLDCETRSVYRELKEGDLSGARKALAGVVGRDTERLDEEGVARAAVETIAENTVDAVVAPLLYLALGGPVLGMAYKAVSTLDSMVGYKNERYLHLGWASARLDDIANFIPARLAGWVLIPAAACFTGYGLCPSLKTVARDRRKHESPNSAYGEAAVAGALGVWLGGSCYYGDRLVEHPVIGEGKQPVKPDHIKKAIYIMYLTAILALGLAVLIAMVKGE